MNGRLARLALGLYPLAFRRRYGQEMHALLDQAPLGVSTVLDLLRGALVAHLRPPAATAGVVGAADRVRASASGVLACWVVFAAAGFGFYKTTENFPGRVHRVLGAAHFSVQALGVVGSVAVILGALPLIIAALARARREPSLRVVVSVPALAVLLFAGLTGVIILLARSRHAQQPTTVGGIGFILWGVAGLACGAACVIASRKALFEVTASRAQLVTAFWCGTLVTSAMVAMTVAVTVYAVALPLDASRLAGSPTGPLQAISVTAGLVMQVVAMALAAALGVITTRRGWRAAGQLGAAG